jgi:hypothetical protein
MKFRPVVAELFHTDRRTDGQTDMTKMIVAYNNFLNSPNNTNKEANTLSCKKPEISTIITPRALTYFILQFLPFNGEQTEDISKLD